MFCLHRHGTPLSNVLFVQIQCDEILQTDGQRQTRSSRRKRYLIGKHVAGGYDPIGRATRGWVAYNLDDGVMVFLKEQWRRNSEKSNPEMNTYQRLRQHGVRAVATLIAGGDVAGHRTVSQRYLNKDGYDLSERIQTRLIFKEVGRPLGTYCNSPELISLVTQALIGAPFCHCLQLFSNIFLGHQQAWVKAGVLHRDVSVANILIDVESAPGVPRAILNDWDLCKYKEQLEIPSSIPGVSVSVELIYTLQED